MQIDDIHTITDSSTGFGIYIMTKKRHFFKSKNTKCFWILFQSVSDKAILHFRTDSFWSTLWFSKDSDCTVHNLSRNQIKRRAYQIHFWNRHWFENYQHHRKRVPRFRSFSRKGSSCFKTKIVFQDSLKISLKCWKQTFQAFYLSHHQFKWDSGGVGFCRSSESMFSSMVEFFQCAEIYFIKEAFLFVAAIHDILNWERKLQIDSNHNIDLFAMAAFWSATTGISISGRAQNVCHRHYKPSFVLNVSCWRETWESTYAPNELEGDNYRW